MTHNVGIQISHPVTREDFISGIPKEVSTLEIGPFAFPTFNGNTVKYFDVLTSEQIIHECERLKISSNKTPKIIHYVDGITSINNIEERFDAVFSSHVIEHTLDIYRHINEVADILNDSGRYYLAIPDKRYCFDYFKNPTTPGDAIQAYQERRSDCPLNLWIDRYLLGTHNDAARHWLGDHGSPPRSASSDRTRTALMDFHNPDRRLKMAPHLWFLTPETFIEIMDIGHKLGYTNLRLEYVSQTLRGTAEFYAALTR